MRRSKKPSNAESDEIEKNVQQCLMAAMNTVNEINDMAQGRQMFRAFLVCGRTQIEGLGEKNADHQI